MTDWPIHPVDLVVMTLLAVGAIMGMVRGLSRELAGLLRVAGTVALAFLFHERVGHWLYEHASVSARTAYLAAFVALLLAGYVVLIVTRLLAVVLAKAFAGPLERIGGLLAGALKAALACVLLLVLADLAAPAAWRQAISQDSASGAWTCAAYPVVYEKIGRRYPEMAAWTWRPAVAGDSETKTGDDADDAAERESDADHR